MVIRSKNIIMIFFRRWLIEFDNNDEDQFMRYDCVVKYADKGASTFDDFKIIYEL